MEVTGAGSSVVCSVGEGEGIKAKLLGVRTRQIARRLGEE